MKSESKFLIITLLVLSFYNIYANEKDSLRVYLMESDSIFSVNLVFENVSKDTILIPTVFRNYLPFDRDTSLGIRIMTYY